MRSFVVLAVLLALGACVDTRLPVTYGRITTEADFRATAAGKSITNGNTSIAINRNGTITGSTNGAPIKGIWKWQEGYWCRQITEPAVSEVDCQLWEVRGRELTITRARGTGERISFLIDRPD
jgi:hypothetical protein